MLPSGLLAILIKHLEPEYFVIDTVFFILPYTRGHMIAGCSTVSDVKYCTLNKRLHCKVM